MCLNISKEKHTISNLVPRIAAYNILVYKYLVLKAGTSPAAGYRISPYRGFTWVFGVLVKATLDAPRNLWSAKKYSYRSAEIHKGLHSYRGNYSGGLFPAIIPKGSEFYFGTRNDIVSNQLIVFRNMEEIQKLGLSVLTSSPTGGVHANARSSKR